MSVGIGIIGLQASGRTTVFNALTAGRADTAAAQKAPHVGIAKLPDARIDKLVAMFQPRKISPAEVKYIDIGASVKSLTDKSVSGEYLTQLQNADALINVVRSFKDDSIPHPEGSIDIGRDMASMGLELAFSDLAIIERRLNRLGSTMKSPKAEERHAAQVEKDLLVRIKADLENDILISEQKLSDEERRLISGYQFLSGKPMLTIINIGEDELPRATAIEEDLNKKVARPDQRIIALCGKLEVELALLDEASAAVFRQDYGLAESGLGRAIRASFQLLGLINFFTTGPDEVKAWPIKTGTIAQKAAGKIHSDIERGFIRAEVISYEDLMKCGTMAEGRRHGVLRQEGKTYIVKDGDIINFLFNV